MEHRRQLIIKAAQAALIVGLGVLIYWPSMHGPFVFDDIYYILRNPAIKYPEKLYTIFWGNVTPLRFIPFLSFALNYHYHRLEVFGFHAVNLTIHLINTILVWWLGTLILHSKAMSEKIERTPDWVPYIGALFFLTHPLCTQAVSYLSQRFTSLVTLFYLLTLCLHACYRQKGRVIFVLGACVSAVAAMFSKQIAITLPAAVLLIDLAFLRPRKRGALTSLVLFSTIALIIPFFHHFAAASILNISQASGSHQGDFLIPGNYLLTQFRVICTYLKLLILPIGQNFLYDFPASRSLWEANTLVNLLALVSLLIFGLRCWKDHRLISFGILWFFLTLSVESSIITIGHVIFEHRAYLPSVGIFMALSFFLAQRIPKKEIFTGLCIVIIMTLSVLTYQRNKVWSDGVLFWSDVVKKSPGLAKAYLNLGVAYADAGNDDQALRSYEKAIGLDNNYAEAYSNRGVIYMKMGNHEKALADFNRAIELNDAYLNAFHNRGTLYAKSRQFKLAMADLNKALTINPSHPESYNERGTVYLLLHRPEEALEDFQQAVLYDPGYVMAYNNRGAVYNELKEYDIAVRDFKLAIRLDPKFAPAHYNLSYAYYKKKELEKAWASLQKAIDLNYDVDAGYVQTLKKAMKK